MRKIIDLTTGVLVERVGNEFLVVVPGSLETVKLSGKVAKALQNAQAGHPVDVHSPAVSQLIELGVVDGQSRLSRRGLLRAGAIGAGAGIAVLTMPGAAMASSNASEVPVSFTFALAMFTPGNGATDLAYRIDSLPPVLPDSGTKATFTLGGESFEFDWFTGGFQHVWRGTTPARQTFDFMELLKTATLTYTFLGKTYRGTYDGSAGDTYYNPNF